MYESSKVKIVVLAWIFPRIWRDNNFVSLIVLMMSSRTEREGGGERESFQNGQLFPLS